MKISNAIVSSLVALAFSTAPAFADNFGISIPTSVATFCAESEDDFLENGGFSRFNRRDWSGGLGDDNLKGAPGLRIDANKTIVRTLRMLVEETGGANGVSVSYTFRPRGGNPQLRTRGIEFKQVKNGTRVVFKFADALLPNNGRIESFFVYALGSGAYQTNISNIQVNNQDVLTLGGLHRVCTGF